MTMHVDLNSDMGEGFGSWIMGDDAALLDVVTSANIACGFHAGDPDTMAVTMLDAARKGVGIGAHPGFHDLHGFGRRRLPVAGEALERMLVYQLGAAIAMARHSGGAVRHIKLHGALSNMASEDADLAARCYGAMGQVAPDLIMVVLAGTAQEAAVRDLGLPWAGEIFADRAYNDDATLVDRSQPDAMIKDPDAAARRIVEMLREGAIIGRSGKRIQAAIDTICVHGDSPQAVGLATGLRAALVEAGVGLRMFSGR